MRSKASLVLMEQLTMVLIFAIAAAVCLGIFVRSSQMEEEVSLQEEGLQLARNAVACLKEGRDLKQLDREELQLTVEMLPSEVPGYLKKARVTVRFEDRILCTLVTGWQEVGS